MSLTLLAWLSTVAGLTVAAFKRPVYGLGLYFLTFFVSPQHWWWGDDLIGQYRWNLAAGIILAAAVLLLFHRRHVRDPRGGGQIRLLAVAILLNATFVHLLLAPSYALSFERFLLLAKFVALFFLILGCVRDRTDFRIALWAITLGAGYIGYEATINERGRFVADRLEGIGAASIRSSNELGSLFVTVLPLVAALWFTGSRREKIVVAIVGGMILNVVLLCNSRGTFLALIAAVLVFLITARGAVRKQALVGVCLGGLATFMLLGDPAILERFSTTFTSREELDTSAASRLEYWEAAIGLIKDRPFGSGGDGWKRAFSREYLNAGRSVHNGFLNEAAEWGLQGFLLRLLFIGTGVLLVHRTWRHSIGRGEVSDAVIAPCLLASAAGFLSTCVFGDYLDDEWGYWIVAFMLAYARIYGVSPEPAVERAKTSPVRIQPTAAARA